MDRRGFLRGLGKAAGAGAAAVVAAQAPAVVATPPAIVEKIVEKEVVREVIREVPTDGVTLEQFQQAIRAFENRMISSSDLKRIKEKYMLTHVGIVDNQLQLEKVDPTAFARSEQDMYRVMGHGRMRD